MFLCFIKELSRPLTRYPHRKCSNITYKKFHGVIGNVSEDLIYIVGLFTNVNWVQWHALLVVVVFLSGYEVDY